MIEIGYHPGYAGAFTRHQAKGAYPNGSRVEKVWCEEGDSTPLGTKGIVLGSLIGGPELGIAYFIEWDDKPQVAVGTVAKKVGLVKPI